MEALRVRARARCFNKTDNCPLAVWISSKNTVEVVNNKYTVICLQAMVKVVHGSLTRKNSSAIPRTLHEKGSVRYRVKVDTTDPSSRSASAGNQKLSFFAWREQPEWLHNTRLPLRGARFFLTHSYDAKTTSCFEVQFSLVLPCFFPLIWLFSWRIFN